jgi:hypothetical protein
MELRAYECNEMKIFTYNQKENSLQYENTFKLTESMNPLHFKNNSIADPDPGL